MRPAQNPIPPAVATALLLLLPAAAGAIPGNHAVGLEVSRSAGGAAGLTLAASTWLDGELDGVARLTLRSAPRPEGRAAAAPPDPEVGVRWTPGLGRWRPEVALLAGLRLGGGRAAATGALRAGLARWLGPAWAVGAAAGARLGAPERLDWEAALEVRRAF